MTNSPDSRTEQGHVGANPGRVEILRPSQIIANDLRLQILRGDFDDWARIPHEPELAEMLGVSRHHLREALRLLEQDGLVRVNRGHTGGIVLTSPSPDVLARTFEGIMARQRTPLADLMATRLLIEPVAAELAAQHRTEDDVARLESIIQRRARERVPDNNNAFHIGVVEAAHSESLLLLYRSMSALVWHLDGMSASSTVSDDNHALGERAHRALVRAICDRDAPRAGRYMRQHLEGFVRALRECGLDPDTMTIGDVIRRATEAGNRF